MRRRKFRSSIGMIVGVHGGEGAGGQLGGESATHSAHFTTKKTLQLGQQFRKFN